MLGFIKKDLLMIKSNIKVVVFLLFIYGVMAFQGDIDLAFLLPFMSVMLMISTFSYDAYNNWDAYAITLPNGRSSSVRAKYLSTIILAIGTSIITTILIIAIDYIHNGMIDSNNIISNILGQIFAISLIQALMYPSIYKFGVEKARIGVFIIVFAIAIMCGIIARFIDFTSFLSLFNFMNDYVMIVIPLVAIFMLYVSYKISERIYCKKEF